MNAPRPLNFFRLPMNAFPRIQVAGRFPMGDGARDLRYIARTHALHLHNYQATCRIGRRTFELQPGSVTLTPAGVESQYNLPQNDFHLCIHFEMAVRASTHLKLPIFWQAGGQAPFVAMRMREIIELTRLAQQSGSPGLLARTAASAALHALLAWQAFVVFHPIRIPSKQRSCAALECLVQILDERFCQPLIVSALAAKVGLNQNYLARLFHQRMGVTMQQYIGNRRIELARHLLTTSRMSIKEIGAKVGWPDPQHFNKQFHRLAGLSPSAARAISVV